MSEPLVVIRLDGNGRAYQPGDTLSGQYHVEAVTKDEVRAIEASVLWFTEGKGDEDLVVHEYNGVGDSLGRNGRDRSGDCGCFWRSPR